LTSLWIWPLTNWQKLSDSNLEAIKRPFKRRLSGIESQLRAALETRVRQAIAQAINKQEIVKAFWGELGKSDLTSSLPHYKSSSQTLWLTTSTIPAGKAAFGSSWLPEWL